MRKNSLNWNCPTILGLFVFKSPSLNPIHWRLSTTPRTWRSSSVIFSFDWNRISVKFFSIFNGTKSIARGTIAWKLSTWQWNKQMKTKGCVSHCRLAIYIKKCLKAREEVWKLMLSPTSINEKNNICVYIEGKKQHTQPDKPLAPPSQAHCQSLSGGSLSGGSFTCTPLGLKPGPFCSPRTQKGLHQWMAITLHPTPSYILPETCQSSQHDLKLGKH